jgi:glutamate synthase (NADPH) large chain
VRLQTDGGLKTGLDVIKAAIIGAESFGFGTAPMVALGCKYLRICHLNNCATGVATQHNVLRSQVLHRPARDGHELFPLRGAGVPRNHGGDGRAQHRRAHRPHRVLEILPGETAKQRKLDLTPLLANAGWSRIAAVLRRSAQRALRQGRARRAHGRDMQGDREAKSGGEFAYEVSNFNRSIGARISGEIAKRWGNTA